MNNHLKSNMDRFIDRMYLCISFPDVDLKSNMDRFIASRHRPACGLDCYLKSNMDRFIDTFLVYFDAYSPIFKIQYG